jgi:thiamine-monophosphate kinase
VSRRIGSEREIIERYFAPLSAGAPGAYSLADDCASIAPRPGDELIVTVDAVVAGVHVMGTDRPGDMAYKAVAVNVSDLAGKAALPLAYLMSIAFPDAPEEDWVAAFTEGLAEAQRDFGLTLIGGDTDTRPGPLSVTITAIGTVPVGRMVHRSSARPGDLFFVTGTIGDAALGLDVCRDGGLHGRWRLTDSEAEHLRMRYLRPQPRVGLRQALMAHASAAMDISDGLLKDLASLCRASQCGATIDAKSVPLSLAAAAALRAEASLEQRILTGGDDYEILASVPAGEVAAFVAAARAEGVAVTEIGHVRADQGVCLVGAAGVPLEVRELGWDHFNPR